MISRLELFIRRLQAQRACLNLAARRLAGFSGPVIELGLGNGRTYDHLRELFPEREIYVFDREIAAHPDCIPDDEHMILGEFQDTLPGALRRIGSKAALVHGDFGTAYPDQDARLASWLGRALEPLVRHGAIVVTDRALTTLDWPLEPLPEDVEVGAYFMYRVP